MVSFLGLPVLVDIFSDRQLDRKFKHCKFRRQKDRKDKKKILTTCATTVRAPACFKIASMDQAVALATAAADFRSVVQVCRRSVVALCQGCGFHFCVYRKS